MNWTKEIPTVDGWYWIKTPNTKCFLVHIKDQSFSDCSLNYAYGKESWEYLKLQW